MSDLLNSNNLLFKSIDPDDLEKMYACLQGRKKKFSAGETIFSFDKDTKTIGVILSGTIRLERIDYFGECTLLDILNENDIFGEILAYSAIEGNAITAVCENDCEIIFFDHDKLIHPCDNTCTCHLTAISNLLIMTSNKAQRLSRRVEVLSSRSIRNKLMNFFSFEMQQAGSNSFTLPFSISDLASYICADRSAMMREISKMKKEGLIETKRRNITLKNKI